MGTETYTIIGLGELLWDLFPEKKQLGGAPANFAYMTSLLGDDAKIASRIGRDALGAETIQALKSSMSTLKAKAPDDAQAYRDFVLNVAKSVGEAAKGTSASESDAIQKIDAALATA